MVNIIGKSYSTRRSMEDERGFILTDEKKNKGNIIANEGKDNRGKWRQISENHYNNRINNRTIKEEKMVKIILPIEYMRKKVKCRNRRKD